jgi:hypothetical protein
VYARNGGQAAGELLVCLLARQPSVRVDARACKSAAARKLLVVKQLDQPFHLPRILVEVVPRALGRSLQLAPERLQHRHVGTQPAAAILLAQVGGQVVARPHQPGEVDQRMRWGRRGCHSGRRRFHMNAI